jgi:hypothetical protein
VCVCLTPLADAGEGVAVREPATAAAERASRTGPEGSHWHAGRPYLENAPHILFLTSNRIRRGL